jgi:hypothetical protein
MKPQAARRRLFKSSSTRRSTILHDHCDPIGNREGDQSHKNPKVSDDDFCYRMHNLEPRLASSADKWFLVFRICYCWGLEIVISRQSFDLLDELIPQRDRIGTKVFPGWLDSRFGIGLIGRVPSFTVRRPCFRLACGRRNLGTTHARQSSSLPAL